MIPRPGDLTLRDLHGTALMAGNRRHLLMIMVMGRQIHTMGSVSAAAKRPFADDRHLSSRPWFWLLFFAVANDEGCHRPPITRGEQFRQIRRSALSPLCSQRGVAIYQYALRSGDIQYVGRRGVLDRLQKARH